jgi:hypothetical protein
LTGSHGGSGLDKKSFGVGINRTPAIGVFDHDHIAVALISAGKDDLAVSGRFNRGSAGGNNVDPLVKSMSTVNRVPAGPKS